MTSRRLVSPLALNKARLIMLAIFMAMHVLPVCINQVMAADTVQMGAIREAAEKTEDRSREGLTMVFGDVVVDPLATTNTTSSGDSDQTVLSSVFRVLNGLGLLVGIIVVGFVIFRKVFAWGNDGAMFKAGTDNSFSVIKMVWGFTALVPTGSGWSLAQLAILWGAALIGVGTANLATDAAMDSFAEGSSMIVEPARPETQSLAKALFQANLCAIGINQGIQNAEAQGADLPDSATIRTITLDDTGFVLASANQDQVCGGARYPEKRRSIQVDDGYNLHLINADDYRTAQINALNQMQNYLAEQSENFATLVYQSGSDQQLPNTSLIIANAARKYDQALGTANSITGETQDQFRDAVVESVQSKGWWELGAWYNTFARANSVVADYMLDTAKPIGESLQGSQGISSAYRQLAAASQKSSERIYTTSSIESESTSDSSSYQDVKSTDGSASVEAAVSKIFGGGGLTQWFVDRAQEQNDTVNPLLAMKSLGDKLLVTTQTAFYTYAAVKGAERATDKTMDSFLGNVAGVFTGGAATAAGGFMVGVIEAISPFVVIGLFMLFTLGATLSVYVPFIPFIIWFSAIINWVVFVAIGVVAAPLWAFAHLTGEERDQRTQHGYIFLVNAMLRPVLMVASFFIAGAIVVMGGTFLNLLFLPAVGNVQADSVTGLITMIAVIGLYVSMSVSLITTSFNLIFLIPDRVMEFLGGTQLANGQGMEDEQRRSTQAVGAWADRAGQHRTGQGQSAQPGSSGSGGNNSIRRI